MKPTDRRTLEELTSELEKRVRLGASPMEVDNAHDAIHGFAEALVAEPPKSEAERQAAKWTWRQYRVTVGALLVLVVVLFALVAWFLPDPAQRLAAFDTFASLFWKVFALYLAGDAIEVISDALTVKRRAT